MIKDERFILLVAESTNLIMKTEAMLKELGISCRILPLPSQLKASCGLSIKIQLEDVEKVKEELIVQNIILEGYMVEKKGMRKYFEKLF
ncbi:MAG: DUF3343 domain-containing protein [Fusobacteriaceae bacterium]|nr:DUF3343 domain-containing protein [Fusobacteriaceae bacterium]